jgi:hypothetical protein
LEDDDIRPEALLSDWNMNTTGAYDDIKRRCGELGRLYGNREKEGSPCRIFNKMLAHPTSLRGMSYDYTVTLKFMWAILDPIISEFLRLKSAREAR